MNRNNEICILIIEIGSCILKQLIPKKSLRWPLSPYSYTTIPYRYQIQQHSVFERSTTVRNMTRLLATGQNGNNPAVNRLSLNIRIVGFRKLNEYIDNKELSQLF